MMKHITLTVFFRRVLNAFNDLNTMFIFSNLIVTIVI